MVQPEEDFQMTDDEAKRIKEALKQKEFMDLLVEYAKEISDPENKKKYEKEIIAMEKQRGEDVKLLKPQSGFVVKTVRFSDNKKVFLNICTSPEVKEFELKHVKGGANVSLPHSVSPGREDMDKAGKPSIVYDICFHPKSYEKGINDAAFRTTMIDSAFDTIEKQMKVKLDRKNKKFPKMKYKGQSRPLIIRSEKNTKGEEVDKNGDVNGDLEFPYPDIEKKVYNEQIKTDLKAPENKDSSVTPKYKILHRGFFDMADFTGGSTSSTTPKELVVEIELPLAKSANGLDLDIFSQKLVLKSEDPSYSLDISLPHKVDEDNGKAQFDKTKKVLIVTLPILRPEPLDIPPPIKTPLIEECSDGGGNSPDSGIGMSLFQNTTSHPSGGQDDMSHTNTHNAQADRENTVYNLNDLEDATFETKNFESMPLNAQLPEYSFEQTIEKIIFVVKVENVHVQDISLGFTHQQVCLSLPQDANEADSTDWSLVIRLDDKNFLDKDACGFDLFEDRIELTLVKKSQDLWHRIFVGVSETSLKMEVFLVDGSASGIVEQLKALNVDKLPRAEVCDEEELKSMDMERRLEQLLREQEKQREINETKYEKYEARDVTRVKREQNPGSFSEGSDMDFPKIDLMELVDDVIDEGSPLPSPTKSRSHEEFSARTNRTLERSFSYDPCHPQLRSILKRSRSDGANNTTDTDDDAPRRRVRSTTYSDRNHYSSETENEFSRRRNKSVSFMDKPTVHEFIKVTKWQWKKQELKKAKKEKKKSKGSASSDQTASSTDDEKTKQVSQNEKQEEKAAEQGKSGRKWKKAQKKQRNRTNSESRSEEEPDKTTEKKDKRKKKNKKNKDAENYVQSQDEKKRTLSNPLIFQLD